MTNAATFLALAAVALAAAPAAADVIHRTKGGRVVGEVLEDESDDASVVVRTRIGKLRIKRSEISRIEAGADDAASYEEAVKQHPDTAEGNYAIGEWCRERGQRKLATEHYRKALVHDTDHPEARRRLGYTRVGEKWQTVEEAKAAQGMVKNAKGQWVTPQQKEEEQQKAANKRSRSEFFQKIRVWLALYRGGTPQRQAEVLANLRALTDPAAVEPAQRLLGDPKNSEAERRLAVEALKGIDHPEAVDALVKLALADDSQGVRDETVAALAKRRSPALLKKLLAGLKDNDNRKVNRAADALAEVGDKSALPELIEALETKHKHLYIPTLSESADALTRPYTPYTTVVRPDGSMVRIPNPNPPGSQGGVGSSPQMREVTETRTNPAVLAALEKLTDESFGYDKAKWLAWLRTAAREKAEKVIKDN